MYAGPIVDTHMHLWDLSNGYAWLSSPVPEFERLIGNYDELRRNCLAPDYIALTRDSNVVKSVHVQPFGFPGHPGGRASRSCPATVCYSRCRSTTTRFRMR